MLGGGNINYIKFAQDNQKIKGYKIININKDIITIECNTCHAIKTMKLKSLYKSKKNNIHNNFCTKYWKKIGTTEVGNKAMQCFYDCYRRAHERCCNPHCKDYERYQGMFKYRDFVEYYFDCFELFKSSIKTIPPKDISIDRIDNNKGYEIGNVRFVTMTENLQNKSNVMPVKMTNIKTNQIITGVSFGDLARKYKDVTYVSVLHRACKANRLYKKEWKVEYDRT